MIQCLRAIQAQRVPDKPPPWPHQYHLSPSVLHDRQKKDKQALMLPRLPDALIIERNSTSDSASVCSSEVGDPEVQSTAPGKSNDGEHRLSFVGKKSLTRTSLSQIAGKLTFSLKRRFGSGSSKV